MFLAEINRFLTLGLVKRFKNSDFILKNKMAEPNQNKKSQQPVWPDFVWKLCFILQINHMQYNCLHVFYKMVILKVLENLRERRHVSWLLMKNYF